MTPEQKAAFVVAQTALMNAEMEMMKAVNKEREQNGYSLAYGGEQWSHFISRWEDILGHNALVKLFTD